MRAGHIYTCPACGETSPVGVDCPRCQVPMRDEHGHEGPPLPELEGLGNERPAGVLLAGMLLFVLALFSSVFVVTERIGPEWLRRLLALSPALSLMVVFVPIALHHAYRRAVRAWRYRQGGVPGMIRGRVHVVEPVITPTGERVAAWSNAGEVFSGRFEVVDSTGAAVLLDDDWIDLGRADVLREGDLVCVNRPAPQKRRGGAYRSPTSVQVDGSPGHPLVVVLGD